MQDSVRDPLLTTLTVLLVLLLFFVAPLHAAGMIESRGIGFAIVLVLVGGVLVMSRSAITVIAMAAAVGLAVAAAVVRFQQASLLDLYLDASAGIIIGVTLIAVVARAVFAPGRVTYHRITGAILLYLTIGVTFVALFTLVGLLVPNAFSGLRVEDSPSIGSNLIYFSFVTLTSIGYGDIVPVHPMVRSLCNLEGIIGQLYPATLLARLVMLEFEGRRK